MDLNITPNGYYIRFAQIKLSFSVFIKREMQCQILHSNNKVPVSSKKGNLSFHTNGRNFEYDFTEKGKNLQNFCHTIYLQFCRRDPLVMFISYRYFQTILWQLPSAPTCTCKINYFNIEQNYINMQLVYIRMKHDYVNML